MEQEQEHLEKVLAGDIHAFRYFVERYQDMAYGIAHGIVRNRSDTEEIVQDAFLKAFRNLAKFKGTAKFSTWLYRIVVNEALRRTKRKTLPRAEVDPSDLGDVSDAAIVNEGLQKLAVAERKTIIDTILQRLPTKEALVLRLFYLHEMSVREVHETTGFSTAHVKTLLHRGRNRFYTQARASYQKELWL